VKDRKVLAFDLEETLSQIEKLAGSLGRKR
jgi:hypothetical protein